MTKLSIIIPVYNVEMYLSRCIESILSQSFQDYEILLVDDGSSDASGCICDSYALRNDRIKAIHQANQGVSAARNAGLKASCGEFVTFIDSDDEIRPTFLNNFSFDPEIDFEIQGFTINYTYDTSKNKAITPESTRTTSLYGVYAESEYQKTSRGPCCKLFKNEIIQEHRIMFPVGISFGEDAIFVKRYLVHCRGLARSISAADYLYCHRDNQISLTTRQHPAQAIYNAAWLDFQLYEQLEEKLGKMPPHVDADYRHIRTLEFYLSIVTCATEARQFNEKKKFIETAKEEMFQKVKEQDKLPASYKFIHFCLNWFPIGLATSIFNLIFSSKRLSYGK